MTRTIYDATYAYNRRPENRRIYAEQQIDWSYTDLLKAQRGCSLRLAPVMGEYWNGRLLRAYRNLAEAHARLAALDGHGPLCAGTNDPVECDCGPEGGLIAALEVE